MTDDQKIAKKEAKAQVKAVKKLAQGESGKVNGSNSSGDLSPAERSADAAERQVRLQRWRVAFTLISSLIALATLGTILFRQ